MNEVWRGQVASWGHQVEGSSTMANEGILARNWGWGATERGWRGHSEARVLPSQQRCPCPHPGGTPRGVIRHVLVPQISP